MNFLLISVFAFVLSIIDARMPPDEENMPTIAPVKTIKYNSDLAMVKLNIYKHGRCEVCSGSFVNPKWILTAAHCVHDAQGVIAEVNNHFNSSCSMSFALNTSDIIIHPSFKTQYNFFGHISKRSHDIALIKFNEETSCKTVWLTRLPDKTLTKGSYFNTFAPLRRFSNSCNEPTTKLAALNFLLKILGDHYGCDPRSIGGHIDGLLDQEQVCVFASYNNGICDGDTSGHIFKRDAPELIGLMTHIPGRSCLARDNVVFTLVIYYVEWIQSHFTNE